MNYDPTVTEHVGPYGEAFKLPAPGRRVRNHEASVCGWIITAPIYHPLWSQYKLDVIRLGEIPGLPPARLKFDGATHELIVVAINPERGVWDRQRVVTERFKVGILTPVNIAEQYEATDEEMTQLADLCVQGVLHGLLNPETADAPTRIREDWLTSTVRTLAYMRGEAHAR